MILTLRRVYEDERCTLGLLRVGDLVLCVLEDPAQDFKVPGLTRIPAGAYDLALRKDSPMAERYRGLYGPAHSGMVWLQNVEGFTWIYFHIGNTAEDTSGCLLVGEAMSPSTAQVHHSARAYRRFFERVIPELDAGIQCQLQITDDFLY